MNSYERIMTALELKVPDRVPISELSIDPKVYKALIPHAKEQDDIEVAFGLDTVRCVVDFGEVSEEGDYYTDEWGLIYKKVQKAMIQ